MAPKPRRIFLGLAIALLIAAGPIAFLDYVLPHHAVLRIVGTEVKRANQQMSSKRDVLRDIFYVYAEDINTKKPHVFRNEDTGWGFPWYFKFNSADIQAAAQSMAAERDTAVVTYYGWRIQIFSSMPNVTKLVRAGPDAWPIPWFNLAFFSAIIGGGAWLVLRIRGVWNRRRLAREAARAESMDSAAKDADAG